jgi:hypothetical protein
MGTPPLRIDPNHIANVTRFAELSTHLRQITTRPAELNAFISKNGELNTTERYLDPQDASRHYRLPAYRIGNDQNRDRVKLELINASADGVMARLKVYLTSSLETSAGKATGQQTIEPGTGFIFSSQKITSGTGVDRDIWWNRRELVPKNRMYSLGRISDVEDILQIATGEFKFDAFVPSVGKGFAIEIKRNNQVEYAILHIISVADNLTFEWLYPFKKQVTGHSERNSRSISTKVTRITFDRFPDGTPITPERFLTGDEFLSKGIRLAGAPEASYCSEATATAIRPAGTYGGVTFPFLTTASPGVINRCNSIPIAITFAYPTRQVSLTFAGASVTYVMKAYDRAGRLLGTAQKDAVFKGGTFDITFNSETTNISKVTFGYQAAITAIKEIRYESPESTDPSAKVFPLPHDVALALKYMIPEKVEGTGRGGTWKNIEFDEVKQTGEKAIEATLSIRSKPELDGIYRAMSEAQLKCQIAVHCEADLCYQPSPNFIGENGQTAYVKVRASHNQTLPFYFPTDTHGYIYPPGYTPTVEVALLRHQVSHDQAIYEDTTQPALFYYLPEEFRLTRDDVAPYHSSLQVAFQTLSAQSENTLDSHQVEFTFKAVPYLKQERIKAALDYIEQNNNLVPTGKIPSLAPLNPDSARFFLTLPKDEGGFEVAEREQAHIVFNRQIIDTLILSSKAFTEVFHSMRVGGETLNGHVKIRLPGRNDEQEIPFSGRLDKMVGPITEQFLVNQSSADKTTYKINVINAIESPIALHEAIFYLRFDSDQEQWAPAIAAPGTLPLSLLSGEEKEITLNSTRPISHAWSVKLEPIKTKIELDFEALWLSVQETPGWQDLTHDVTVQVDERYFTGPDALDKVIVTFNKEEATVTLTRNELSKTVNLIKPFLLYLLRDEEANDYVYKVSSYRSQQLIATQDFPQDDAPLLNIDPPLEA